MRLRTLRRSVRTFSSHQIGVFDLPGVPTLKENRPGYPFQGVSKLTYTPTELQKVRYGFNDLRVFAECGKTNRGIGMFTEPQANRAWKIMFGVLLSFHRQIVAQENRLTSGSVARACLDFHQLLLIRGRFENRSTWSNMSFVYDLLRITTTSWIWVKYYSIIESHTLNICEIYQPLCPLSRHSRRRPR